MADKPLSFLFHIHHILSDINHLIFYSSLDTSEIIYLRSSCVRSKRSDTATRLPIFNVKRYFSTLNYTLCILYYNRCQCEEGSFKYFNSVTNCSFKHDGRSPMRGLFMNDKAVSPDAKVFRCRGNYEGCDSFSEEIKTSHNN